MAEKAFLDGEGLQQTVEWLRNKDVGEYTDDTRTNEIFNDYYNNIAKGTHNHAEGYQTKALGAYNHAEGYNTSAGSYKDAYYRYCGNPILQVPNSTDVINKVSVDSNTYRINEETGTFLLDKIDLPEDFKVGKYSSTLKILDYNYIFNDNKWYDLSSVNIELTEELNSLFTILFNDNATINRKIYQVSTEPTNISNDLYIYNGAIYCSAFTDNKIEISAETITTLTTINTLEAQANGYITTLYVNESNSFGFIYYFIDDDLILYKQQYDIEYSIDNLTNNYGTFKKIDQIYQSAPTITTQEGVVCGTSYDLSTTPQYSGNSGKWEYLSEYNVILSLTESDRVIYDSEGNPTGEVNPSLVVTHYNAEDLINKTVDFNTDNINFVYSKTTTEEATTLDWYLNDTIVDLADYGISVENPQEYDIITFELNRFYISYDSEGNQVEKNQEEFYIDNHASDTIPYVFNGTASGNWVKTVKDGVIDGSVNCCHAEGYGSKSSGYYNHVEGMSGEITTGTANHVEGMSNKISDGAANHTEGMSNYIYNGTGNHAEGNRNKINETIGGDYNSVRNYNNTIDGSFSSDICGGDNTVKNCSYTSVNGQSNSVTNDHASLIYGMNNNIVASSWRNIVGGDRNKLNQGGLNIISGQDNEVQGNGNIVVANSANVNGGYNLISGDINNNITGDCNIIGGTSQYDCNGSNNLVFGNVNEVNGNNNLISGVNNKIQKNNSIDFSDSNAIFGSINNIYSVTNNIIGGKGNKSYNNSQFIFGQYLLSGDENNKNSRTALTIGEYNNNSFTNIEYILTKDTIYYYNYAKLYYYIKNEIYYPIEVLNYTTPNSNWYELINDEYAQTKDKEMLENKDYYYRYSNDDYRLIKIANTEITQPIYEIKQYIIIAGNGINTDNRTNALELDYQGNLKTSGDIVNGNGVAVGAYISNEKIDEIWNSIFEEGRVCLVQTSS